jgi:molybdenum cofactor guanylyltransferase
VQATPRILGAGGVVLAGGRSSRMGTPKAALDWHGTTLLYRTTALLKRALGGPVVVVAAPGQELPELPPEVEVVHDPTEGIGPLQGIATGLRAVDEAVPIAFVCSTDLPFLHPAYVHAVLTSMDDVDVALPMVDGFRQTLAAGYRTELGEQALELLEQGGRTPGELFAKVNVRELSADELLANPYLAHLDPELTSVRNINTPEEYEQALAEPQPEVTIHLHGTWSDQGRNRSAEINAANLGEAAKIMRVPLSAAILLTVNAERVQREPLTPLVRGDSVALLTSNVGG